MDNLRENRSDLPEVNPDEIFSAEPTLLTASAPQDADLWARALGWLQTFAQHDLTHETALKSILAEAEALGAESERKRIGRFLRLKSEYYRIWSAESAAEGKINSEKMSSILSLALRTLADAVETNAMD